MMPDLGKYAGTVLGSYGVTLVLLGGLVLLSVLRGAQVRRALADRERARGRKDDHGRS